VVGVAASAGAEAARAIELAAEAVGLFSSGNEIREHQQRRAPMLGRGMNRGNGEAPRIQCGSLRHMT